MKKSRRTRREQLTAVVLSILMLTSVFVPQWSFGEVASAAQQVQETRLEDQHTQEIRPENEQTQETAVENRQTQETGPEVQPLQETGTENQPAREIKPELQIEYYKSGEGMVPIEAGSTITLEEEGRTELKVNIIKPADENDPNYRALLEKYEELRKTMLPFKVGDQYLENNPIENNDTLQVHRAFGAGEKYDYNWNRRVVIIAKKAGQETIRIEVPGYETMSFTFVVNAKPVEPPKPKEPEAKDQYFNFYLLNSDGEREKLESPDKGWTIYKPYRSEYAVQAELKDSARESLKKDLKDELVSRLKSKVRREVGAGEGPEYEAKFAEGLQEIEANLETTLKEELDQTWWWWSIDSGGVKERQSPIKRLGSGYDGNSDETNIFRFQIVETQEDSDSISLQINNYGNMEPKFDPYRSSVAAIRIRLPKTEAPVANVQLQHKVEGGEWRAIEGDLNLDYDFGEGIHLLKAASDSGKVEWEVAEDVKRDLQIYDYVDGTLRFGATKVGDFTLNAKIGKQKKNITIHIGEAKQPRVKYRVETENLWRYIPEDGLHLLKDKPVFLNIDDGQSGWQYQEADSDQQTVVVSADTEANTWKIEPKKAGATSLRFALNGQNVDVNVRVEEENHLPKVYFQGKDGEKKYLDDQNQMVLTVLDEGQFHIEGTNLKALRWDAKEKYYLTDTKYAFHFWIDQFSRYNPRKIGAQNATVVYEENGKVLKHDFVIQVLPSEIEEIKAYVGDRELTQADPIQVQGSERVHIVVKGKVRGQQEFKVLPETAYRLRDQEDQHIMGSSFALWKPGTFNVNVFMRDNPDVQTNFSARSAYVPVSGLVGEVPAVWEMDQWNTLSGNFNGIRWYESLDKGYTLSVSPRNASVIDLKWESLTPEIAYYDPLYSNGIVPRKPGIAKFVVSSVDKPEIKREVQVEFRYKYPLTSVVAIANHNIDTGKVKNLNLGINPQNASEQRFHWSYSEPGIVHISDTIYTDPTNVNTPKRTVHTMRGIKTGTVKVTGTPYDQTAGARPIEFEVVVKDSVNGNSISDLSDILSWAQNKMNGISSAYASRPKLGDPWKIAENGKLRKEISQDDLDYIYKSLFTDGKLTKDAMKLAKSILALRAAGVDPERYYGHNLISELSEKEMPKDNIYSLSAYLWALSSDNYGVPYIKETREEAVMAILAMQNLEEGLWIDGSSGDLWQDATGFALYALAPYYNDSEEVKHAVELSVAAIGLKQQADGDISDNSNSLAMVAGGKELATEQAFRSLVSYFEGNVFDYRDMPKKGIDAKVEDQENNEPSVPAPGTDGSGHPSVPAPGT
ncbi:MAG: hypothetical protein Q3993_03110, partial [Filifactor alocis]|nr:hypothetical protein [Filifactor alocis]